MKTYSTLRKRELEAEGASRNVKEEVLDDVNFFSERNSQDETNRVDDREMAQSSVS